MEQVHFTRCPAHEWPGYQSEARLRGLRLGHVQGLRLCSPTGTLWVQHPGVPTAYML